MAQCDCDIVIGTQTHALVTMAREFHEFLNFKVPEF